MCCCGLAPCSISAIVVLGALFLLPVLSVCAILSTVLILSVLVLPCSLPSCAELCRSSWMCCRRSGPVWTRCCLFGSSCLIVFLFSLWRLLSALSTFKPFFWWSLSLCAVLAFSPFSVCYAGPFYMCHFRLSGCALFMPVLLFLWSVFGPFCVCRSHRSGSAFTFLVLPLCALLAFLVLPLCAVLAFLEGAVRVLSLPCFTRLGTSAQAPCLMLLSKVQKALCNYEHSCSGAAVIVILLSITELKSKSFWPVGCALLAFQVLPLCAFLAFLLLPCVLSLPFCSFLCVLFSPF